MLFKDEIPEHLKDKVYIAQSLTDDALGKYKIDVRIPMLSIRTDIANRINSEITGTFAKKMLDLISKNNAVYSFYNISFYTAINDDILTLAIKCGLKEGGTAQRQIIKTYNYDMKNEKILTLDEVIEKYNLDREDIQKQINEEVKRKAEKAEEIESSGFNIYKRVVNDTIYKIENTQEFMLDESRNLYIIYPYGNNNITGEMDLIVIPQ